MSTIPTSTSVSESAVVPAKLSQVWHQIKLQDFAKWYVSDTLNMILHFPVQFWQADDRWSALSKSEVVEGSTSPETDIFKWTFTDGTELDIKQEEHSVRLPANQLTYITFISNQALLDPRPLHYVLSCGSKPITFIHFRHLQDPMLRGYHWS